MTREPQLGGPPPGPGARLREARQRLELTVDDVAAELRLSPSQVVALENDCHDDLPGPTYVRGYLRAYGRIVGLSIEQQAVPPPEPPALRAHGARRTAAAGGLVRAVAYLLIGVGLAATFAWWQGWTPSGWIPQDAGRIDLATGRSVERTPAQPATAPVPAAQGVQSEGGAGVAPVASAANAVAAGAATRLRAGSAPAGADTARHLTLEFEQGSWADIRDITDARLLYRTVSQGHVVTVEGEPPFRVFLGNAAGVRLVYRGRRLDVPPQQHATFARFTVGGAEAAANTP